nr:MAG: hypothetical protein [Molluscum contagiosum virus]
MGCTKQVESFSRYLKTRSCELDMSTKCPDWKRVVASSVW